MIRYHEVVALLAACLVGATLPALAQPAPAAAEPRLTSYQLIDRALEAKRIDEETAHKYRVFAAFGDSRLPAQYRGALGGLEPPEDVERAGALLTTFSAQTQAELAPFFMRPDEPGSWITLGTVSDLEAGAPRPPGRELGLSRGTSLPASTGLSSMRFDGTPRRLARSGASAAGEQSTPPVITWRTFSAAGGKVKVWAQDRYVGDAAKAEALAREFDSRIWPRLTGLMRREPVSDAQRLPNGGDGALDVYLVHAPIEIDPETGQRGPAWWGVAKPTHRANSCDSSRYLLINSRQPLVGNRTTLGMLSTAAHEFFHAIAFAFRAIEACDIRWIREGSATWAENWVYPAPNTEHKLVWSYLKAATKPIDLLLEMHAEYGSYVFPLYREKSGRSADFMREMWENFERLNALPGPTFPNTPGNVVVREEGRHRRLRTLRAVNLVLDGGFDETWPAFLVRLWNQTPVDAPDGFKGWDRLEETPWVFGTKRTIETPSGPVTLPIGLPAGLDGSTTISIMPLSGVFTHFAFKSNVRHVVFVNTIAEIAHQHSSVWGIAKIRGRWQDPKNWTRSFQKAWCRDDRTEDIEELVIIFGNSDSERLEPVKPEKLPEIKASPTGCTAWVGTSTAETTIKSTDPALTIVETADATMRFEVDSSQMLAGQPREYWKIKSGQITWTVTVTGACTGGGKGVQAITDLGAGEEMATLRVWEENGTLLYMGTNGPWPGPGRTYRVTCPNQPPVDMPLLMALGWWTTDSKDYKVTENGKVITSTYTTRQPGTGSGSVTNRMSYSLRLSP